MLLSFLFICPTLYVSPVMHGTAYLHLEIVALLDECELFRLQSPFNVLLPLLAKKTLCATILQRLPSRH